MKNQVKQTLGLLIVSFVALAGTQSVQAEDVHAWADFGAAAVTGAAQLLPVGHTPNLAPTTSSMPQGRTSRGLAPGNLALKAVGRNYLPPTRLSSFIQDSGMCEDIYGHDGDRKNKSYSPIASGFDCETYEGLTTGQASDAPSVYAYDTWNK